MVGQVKVVGILMMVHGVTVILMGGGIAALGSWMMFAMPAAPAGGGGPTPEIIAIIYGVYGGTIALCGVLNSVAGFRVMMFRNRVFGLVALFSNVFVLMSCYCALTAVGMLVYGLIVLFNSDVARAFEMVAGGATPEEVVGRLTPRYGDSRDDYDEMSNPRAGWEEQRRRRREPDLDDAADDRQDRPDQRDS
jgi:hypothetical protein